jgi:hypothetical protein
MLNENTTLENIIYKNGKMYSRKNHQKAIENLTKGRIEKGRANSIQDR